MVFYVHTKHATIVYIEYKKYDFFFANQTNEIIGCTAWVVQNTCRNLIVCVYSNSN